MRLSLISVLRTQSRTMTKGNLRPKVLAASVQPTMKRQRPGRPVVRLQPRVENDGHGEEEANSGSGERKVSKIRRGRGGGGGGGGGEESVQILFVAANTGKVPERRAERNIPKIKDPGIIVS